MIHEAWPSVQSLRRVQFHPIPQKCTIGADVILTETSRGYNKSNGSTMLAKKLWH